MNPGDTVAQKYEILRLIGQGGMGAVYEARHKGTGRRVAVKIITAAYLDRDDPRIKRFQREARAAGAIESQHIAQVLDLGEEPTTGAPFMVIELLQGEDLQALMDREGPLSPEVALRIAGQACLGLQKAHDAGVVHRDIKPANVFLARGDGGEIVVKLLDFGIAKIKADQDKITQTSGGLTTTGSILGSPLFMSPEQVVNAKEIDHRTDIWSLGIVLYSALAGKPPFSDITSIVDLLVLMSTEEPTPIREAAPWISAEIAAVVHGAASLDPEARFPSAAALLERIKSLVGGDLRITEEMLGPLPDAVRNSRPSLEAAAASAIPSGPQVVVQVEPSAPGENPRVSVVPRNSSPSLARPGSIPDIGNDATVPFGSVPDRPSASNLHSPSLAPRRPRTALVAGGAGGVALAVVVIGLALRSPGTAPPKIEAMPENQARSAPTATAIEVQPAPSDTKRRVKLVIVPGDAEVEIEGQSATVDDGVIDLEGSLGSVRRVRVWKGKAETTQDIIITEIGAMPPKIELAAPGGPPRAPSKPKLPADIMEDFK